jgi:hypothetical protein
MMNSRCSAAASAFAGLLSVTACSSDAKPVPRVPPNTLSVIADEAEPREGDAVGAAPGPAQAALWRGACGIPVTVSMEGMMLRGGIARIQERLVARELLAAPYREGELDRATIGALLELQRRSELPPVGLPSYATVHALGIDPAQVFVSGSARCGGGGSGGS